MSDLGDTCGATPVEIDPAVALLDADNRVAGDLGCVSCGYNLRTLHRDASCPECARAVRESFPMARLAYAPADWVRDLHRGVRGLLLSFGGAAAAAIGLPFLDRYGAAPLPFFGPIGWIAGAVVVVSFVLSIIRLTRTDPRPDRDPQGVACCAIIRGCLVGLAILCMLVAMGLLSQASPSGSALLRTSGEFAGIAFLFIAVFVLPAVLAWWLRLLVRETRDQAMAKDVEAVSLFLGVSGICLAIAGLLLPASDSSSAVSFAFVVFAAIGAWTGGLGWCMLIVLLFLSTWVLGDAAREARRIAPRA